MSSLPGKKVLGNLFVEGLRVVCILGDLPQERTEPQSVFFDLEAQFDLSAVSLSDRVEDSIDYVALAHITRTVSTEGKYRTVEALAWNIAKQCFTQFKELEQFSLKVRKQGCIPHSESAGCKVTYTPNSFE